MTMSEPISSYDDSLEYDSGTLCLTLTAGEDGEEEQFVVDGEVNAALEAAARYCEERGRRGHLWRVDSDDQSTRLATITSAGDWRIVGA